MCAPRDNDSTQTHEVWVLLRHCVPNKNLQFLRLRLSLQECDKETGCPNFLIAFSVCECWHLN